MKRTEGATVARAATVIMIISVFGKLIGFAREQVIAEQFGATAFTDAYIAAWTVPQMLVGLIGGALATSFVPVFTQHLDQQSTKPAWSLLSSISKVTTLLLVIATVVCFLTAPLVVRLLVPSFTDDLLAITVQLLRIMLPVVVLSGLSLLLSSLFHSFRQFAVPALAPLVLNLCIILLTVLLKGSIGILALAWATLIGAGFQFVLLLWMTLRQRIPLVNRGSFASSGSLQILRLAVPVMAGTLCTQLYMFVDKVLASGLDEGSIAALNYSVKLTQLPVGVFAISLATAIYPTLAECASRKDPAGMMRNIGAGLRLLSLVMVPAAVGLIVLRGPIVRLAFERGSFDALATQRTSTALGYYAIGLLGMANIHILTRGFYSLRDTLTPVKVSIVVALGNIALAVILVEPLGHGGLALANSLSILGNMGLLMALLKTKTRQPLAFLGDLIRMIIAAGIMGLAVHWTYLALTMLGQTVALLLAVITGLVVYTIMIIAFRIKEAKQLWTLIQRRRVDRQPAD